MLRVIKKDNNNLRLRLSKKQTFLISLTNFSFFIFVFLLQSSSSSSLTRPPTLSFKWNIEYIRRMRLRWKLTNLPSDIKNLLKYNNAMRLLRMRWENFLYLLLFCAFIARIRWCVNQLFFYCRETHFLRSNMSAEEALCVARILFYDFRNADDVQKTTEIKTSSTNAKSWYFSYLLSFWGAFDVTLIFNLYNCHIYGQIELRGFVIMRWERKKFQSCTKKLSQPEVPDE